MKETWNCRLTKQGKNTFYKKVTISVRLCNRLLPASLATTFVFTSAKVKTGNQRGEIKAVLFGCQTNPSSHMTTIPGLFTITCAGNQCCGCSRTNG
jgi:hypothetical protein